MELKDKIVVITGGSKGLGRSLAESFVKEGAIVVISSKNKKELQTTANEIKATSIPADVSREFEVKNLAEEVIQKFKKIDIWVNNAGIWMPHVSVEELDIDKVREIVDVNLFGTINGSKVSLIQMNKQGHGTIINIISTSALSGRPKSSGYSASKHAVAGFTKSLVLETAGSNIKVLAIYPGGMKTHFFDEKKPADIDQYMEPAYVAERIIANLKSESPEPELIIKRPTA